jgi:hypothetical protein
METVVEPGLQDKPPLFCFQPDRLGLTGVSPKRLFAEDVLPMLESGQGDLPDEFVWGGDNHAIDIIPPRELSPIDAWSGAV